MTTASPRLHRLVAAFDRGLLQLAPAWAASRAQSRVKAVAYRQAYEAAEKTHLRQASRDFGSGNTIVTMTGVALRNQARHLDRNHDIISGGLSTLVQNIIGPSGINIVPTPATSTATWLNHWWMPSSPSTTPGPNVPKSPGCTTGPASSAELDRWKYAAGHEVRGLVLRRVDERALCEGRAS